MKAGFQHPGDAFSPTEVEASIGHDQHMETSQQTPRAKLSFIVDQAFKNDNGPPDGSALYAFFKRVFLVPRCQLCSTRPNTSTSAEGSASCMKSPAWKRKR